MPTEMLDRLQENKLRGLEEFLDSWKADTASAGGEDETVAIADFIVDEGIGVRQGLLRFWDYYWMAALSGKIPDRQKEGATIRSLLDRGASSLARAAAVARKDANFSGHEVARLAQFEEQVKAFSPWVEECMALWELLDRPRKPLNRERLVRSQAAYERGECEDAANIIARHKQGGPLVKE